MCKQILLAAALICLAGLSYHYIVADIFDDIGKAFKGLGKDIEKTAKGVIKDIEKTGKEAGKWFEDRAKDLKKIPACLDVVKEGTEWTAKKGAFTVAEAVVKAGKDLQVLDPRRAALQTEKAGLLAAKTGLDATQQAARAGLEATKALASATSSLGKVVGKMIAGSLIPQQALFEANLEDLLKGKSPLVELQFNPGGKPVTMKVQLDLNDIPGSIKTIFDSLANLKELI